MRRLAFLLVLVAALASAAPPAAAAGPRLVEAESARFPERAWVLTLPEKREVTARDVQLRENGRVVENLSVLPSNRAGRSAFGVVLAIDASESMHGDAILDAMAAAREFAARREPSQPLGLVLFSREHRVALPLTTDQARIDAALAETPELTKGTRVLDAAAAAIELLHDAKVRAGSVVVLSDGADAGSTTTTEALGAAARKAHVRVFSVGLASASFTADTLAGLADQTGGAFTPAASGEELKAIYASLGEQLSRQYLVSYRSLATLGTRVDVRASIAGVDDEATAAYEVPALTTSPTGSDPTPVTGTMLVLALLVVLLLVVALLLVVRRPQASVVQRVGEYVQPPQRSMLDDQAIGDRSGVLSRLAEHVLERAHWWPRFKQEVELANLGMSASQLLLLTVLGTFSLVWSFAAIGRPVAAGLLALTPLVVRSIVVLRTGRVRRAFADQLADNLQVVASAMRAGHSFEGALAMAAEDAAEPTRSELRRVISDERLGVPVDEAMARVAERMKSADFEQVALVLVVQREAGGNVAELLDHSVAAIRARGDLRRLVTSLTAQGRLGGIVVTALPFVTALLMATMNPGYFDPMLETSVGRMAIVAGFASVGLAWVFIRKVVDIKV